VAKDLAAIRHFALTGFPLYCAGSEGRYVALTFDDGPGLYTAATLQQLEAFGDVATFFLVGSTVGRSALGAALARQEMRDGSAVGDHTWAHHDLTTQTEAQQRLAIGSARQAIESATGEQERLFRPPFGARNAEIDHLLPWMGFLEVMWSGVGGEADHASPAHQVINVRHALHPGAIILLHENHASLQQALPSILRVVRDRGYRAVTIPQLLRVDPPSIANMQRNASAGLCVAR
jgi:peptidoglycan/xylan/chitin deacetylase (PgdA/CDA1 family)